MEHFGRFSSPNLIRSDRGPHYANELIEKFLLVVGTPHSLTLAYSKEENSIVERVNKEVNRHLRSFVFETLEMDQYKLCLPFVQRIMNSSVHGSTGVSPCGILPCANFLFYPPFRSGMVEQEVRTRQNATTG